ncbi:hypothetical protein CAQ16704_0310 [Campylobacter sp. RM16704]|nr:hypothetical protein CAQ16704_0310 [Campylobacter sp. RM16704]
MKYIKDENDNIIYYYLEKSLNSITIDFNAFCNNIIFIAGNIKNIKVNFYGSNSVIFLGENCQCFHIEIASDSLCYIGDNTTSGGANLVAIENQNILIGNDCLFSWEILLTTSDYHGIYDIRSKNRVSFGGGIYIGDHVWCGRRVSILKKSRIYSGSIIGFNSILCSKKVFSNNIFAGIPAKKIKENIFWIKDNIDRLDKKNTLKYNYYFKDDYIFQEDINEYIDFDFIDKEIKSLTSSQDKLHFVYDVIYKNNFKNRFVNFGNIGMKKINRIYYFSKEVQTIISFQTKYGTTKTRIQNQLSYKLGQSMIANSKSFLGYLIMPIALLSIIISHKQEQKIYQEKIKKDPSLKLPPLENYPDYKEALKVKNHLSYKLGQALIQANKNWYGGGYIKLLFEIRKLKKEFRQRK